MESMNYFHNNIVKLIIYYNLLRDATHETNTLCKDRFWKSSGVIELCILLWLRFSGGGGGGWMKLVNLCNLYGICVC